MYKKSLLLILIIFILLSPSYCNNNENYKELPYKVKVAFLIRILEFNNTIAEANEDISIHVINDSYLYDELSKLVGIKINEKKIQKITQSIDDSIPSYNPSVIYIGQSSNVDKISEYAKKNKILTMTGNPKLIDKSITICLVMLFGSPHVIFKTKSSQNENIKWDPKIIKISTLMN